jgi:hypothetical protein
MSVIKPLKKKEKKNYSEPDGDAQPGELRRKGWTV